MPRIAPDVARTLLTRLQVEKRAKAVGITCDFLDGQLKTASDSQKLAFRTIQESLKAGATLGASIKVAMPWMSPVDTKRFAERLVKAAMLNASATGENMPSVGTTGEQSFTGSIADGSSFLGSM